nr:MAG TPA: hypothetical protein [Caudoviricetes sp.]
MLIMPTKRRWTKSFRLPRNCAPKRDWTEFSLWAGRFSAAPDTRKIEREETQC